METFKLNNGVEIPKIGIGTFKMSPDEAEASVEVALSDGYRLIDTANAYLNERAVGRAIKNSGVKRDDIFISSKLWPTVYNNDHAVDDTLKRLNLDYIDLLFLHQPSGDWEFGYRQLEKAYREGKIRAIGISNFHDAKLFKLLENVGIKPQVMQVEAHPHFPQMDLRKLLDPYGTRIMAWYPLGHGDDSLIKEDIFTRLAKKYNKTNVQIILRWHIQVGNIVIPGSTNPDHIKSNLDIFDFSLTNEEIDEIAKINKNERYYVPNDEIEEGYATIKMNFDEQK